MERNRKTVNQEGYLNERYAKVVQQKKRLLRENKGNESIYLIRQLHIIGKTTNGLATSEMYCLFYYVQEKKKEIKKRNEFPEQAYGALQSEHTPPAIEGLVVEKEMTLEDKGSDGRENGSIGDASSPWSEWFSDTMKQGQRTIGNGNNQKDLWKSFGE